MQTRNGNKVDGLVFIKEIGRYVGSVNGHTLTCGKDGRRTTRNRSKLDLVDTKTFLNIRKWGSRYVVEAFSDLNDAVKNKQRGHLKTIQL